MDTTGSGRAAHGSREHLAMWDSGLDVRPCYRHAGSRGARRSTPTTRAACRRGTGQGTRRARPHAAGRRSHWTTRDPFSVRSVFGRPMRCASRAAGEQFLARHYRCFSGQEICPAPLPTVPDDYDKRLRDVRRRSGLSQDALARRIGAASKAVVYQWESRKRTPSPVLWQRVLELESEPAAR